MLPRMVVDFHLDGVAPPRLDRRQGGRERTRVVRRGGGRARLAEADRARAAALGRDGDRAARVVPDARLEEGSSLVNELRRVKSDDRARADGAGVPDRARGDGRGDAARRPRRLDDGRSSSASSTSCSCAARAAPPSRRTSSPGASAGSTPAARATSTRSATARSSSSTSAPSGTATAPTSAAPFPAANRPPSTRVLRLVLLEAQEAGRAAARPGALARDVNAACRAPIEAAGLGDGFRHRMGHGIGLDVHERPFLSVEDETPLEAGMTFTDEPSILRRRPLRRSASRT